MNKIDWNQFVLKNSNPQKAFETICRNIFMREYKVSCHNFTSNYNQTGLETEPVLFENQYYGFQCKYSESGNSTSLYREVYDSLDKAVNLYRERLDVIIVYTNLDIKPNVSEKEANGANETNRIKIHNLGKKNGIKIIWFLKPNFEQALNDVKNYDLYREFFSPQDFQGLLNNALTHNERTFLGSNQFMDLSLNGKKFSIIKENILAQDASVIIGAAGTGKSEVLKKLYLQCESEYLSKFNQTSVNSDISIPIFLKMRECINGDLEGLLRNRLKDFDINIVHSKNSYIYFFDGLDEISTLDFGNVITCITNLKNKGVNSRFVLSSRINTANLTIVLRNFKPKVYTIDPLKKSNVIDYFNNLNDNEKSKRLQEIIDINPVFVDEITDIFSVVLRSDNIFQINKTTTKIDLIKLTTESLIEKNIKYSSINLPEPKTDAVQSILGHVSELMQRTGNISISRFDFQNIIIELFPKCTYMQIDEIINFVSDMFFDSSPLECSQERYSYVHKRYFEYYLYVAIKNVFYENPAILRDLRVLANKDFIINIFLAQEFKKNELSNDIQKVLMLRFLETYLGEAYFRNTNILWRRSEAPLSYNDASYLKSQCLQEYLCTKNIDDLREFIRNDPLYIRAFLSSNNYYSFVKLYHKINGLDVRVILNELYDINDNFLMEASEKDALSYMYCSCVIEQNSIAELYNDISKIKEVKTIDLDYYPYNLNDANFIVSFFEFALESFMDWLLICINNLSTNHLEVLSYILLRNQNLCYIIKDNGVLSDLAIAIVNKVNTHNSENYGIHTIVLYSILTGNIFRESDIQERAENVNTYLYETWRKNFELNNYVGMVLGEKFKPYHYEYRLGITLREIMNDLNICSKKDILDYILQEVSKYDFLDKKGLAYNNAIFIGEIIAVLDINYNAVKKFIVKLGKLNGSISTFQILYTIMRRNTELFKIIANSNLITLEYEKAKKTLSYYEDNSDLLFKYATMLSHFDIIKADAVFEYAINNSIFRPIFKNENILDYYLPYCLYVAYNNSWISTEELESYVKRLAKVLEIAKDTLDGGAYGEYFKFLVEKCCPQLTKIVENINLDAKNPEIEIGWDTYSGKFEIDDIDYDNLPEYYSCKIDGVNYLSISVWKKLIGFELQKDDELSVLYGILEKNYFAGYGTTKVSNCFHVIIAVLLSNVKTKQKAIKFIMDHSGRIGLVNLINAFSLMGEDCFGIQYLESLIKLCEALVYP